MSQVFFHCLSVSISPIFSLRFTHLISILIGFQILIINYQYMSQCLNSQRIQYNIQRMKVGIFVVIVSVFLNGIICLDNGQGLTPPMGWNSWNRFGCNINEKLIKQTADLLVSTGLASKGYKYVNLDDCWQISRNETTKQIIQDKSKFPSGIGALSDYVHDKGLKFGLYSDAGQKTCQGRPGGYGFQDIDAKTYSKWKVDYLKYDNCYNLNISGKIRYEAMRKALNQSGRHIFYSMCNWGEEKSWSWAKDYANSWRTTGDISDKWSSFLSILQKQVGLQIYAGKGGWNDPDMLEVGNGGMTYHEYYAHFGLWCLLKSPLLIGCSLQKISSQTLEILGNQELIAINQDPLGIQGTRKKRQVVLDQTRQVWGGPLANQKYAVIFLNRGIQSAKINVSLKKDLGLDAGSYSVRDVIKHQQVGNFTSDILEAHNVPAHGITAYVIQIHKTSSLMEQ